MRDFLAGLSTGIKMLLILSLALLPLGLIALSASISSAHSNRLHRDAQAQLLAAEGARGLTLGIERVAAAMRAAVDARGPEITQADCRTALSAIVHGARMPLEVAIAVPGGRRMCATPGFSDVPVSTPAAAVGTEARLLPDHRLLRFELARGGVIVVGELDDAVLATLARPTDAADQVGLALQQGEADIRLSPAPAGGRIARVVSASVPAVGAQLGLLVSLPVEPLHAVEVLTILLPILMWVAAALIGWLVADRLLLRPLAQLQGAISAYGVGDGALRLPTATSPAREIKRLGEAFQGVTDKLAAHERELEAGLAAQVRLTREVHHRVKNNLQVVASLINLHARGVADPAVAAAYASIQRRVDALAIVHRNHFAEMEENRGVGLRALISELASNLRATAAPGAGHMTIALDLQPFSATQDVAVPVAFLITELVELVMLCEPRSGVSIRLTPTDEPTRARLTVLAAALTEEACGAHPANDRFTRVVEGLARQLRAKLDIDAVAGRYSINLPVLAAPGEPAA